MSEDERLNVNLDTQWSQRDQLEIRHDLVFAETRRNITEVDAVDGIIQSQTFAGEIQTQTEELLRDEEYIGIGLNVEYQVNDDLLVSGDISYSNTNRLETERDFRTALDDSQASGDVLTSLENLQSSNTPDITLLENVNNTEANPIDLNDPLQFVDGGRLRIRDQITERENTILALRGDFTLNTDIGIINEIKGGVRFSRQDYETFGDVDLTIDEFGDDENAVALGLANSGCVIDFPEDNFLDNISSGGLVTNGVSGEVFDSFVAYDLDCSIDFLLGFSTEDDTDNNGDGVVDLNDTNGGITSASADVEEDTFAAYIQAGYESEFAGFPVRGNFGVRLVNTDVESVGFRTAVVSTTDPITGEVVFTEDPTADFTETVGGGSYTEVLPSFTLVADLSDTLLFRGGVFRGLSRPDPAALAFGRTFTIGDGSTVENFEDAVNEVRATGNPDLEPLTSWNVDAALEWYPNKDTILAAGVYYKKFQGGFSQEAVSETFELDGVAVQGNTITTVTDNESNNLYGIEVTASHSLNYLPGFLGGFGGKLSYNYASSDFEFEDGLAGAGTQIDIDADGNPVETELFGFVDPAGLFGLSRNVASAQLFWSGGAFDAQVIYKYRSQYFQQFTRDTSARIRFVDDNDVLEFRASYKLNDAIRLSFEALNITDEPRQDFRGLDGNTGQILTFGPRYFFGIRAKL